MNWRRALLWVVFFAILVAAILLIVRVAKIAFGARQVSESVLLESRA